MQSIRCQFCDRTSTMFSVFIYVESKRSEELAQRGEYPYTWHPAKVQDPAFQAVLNLQRGRQVEEDTLKKEGIVSKMKADDDARSVALMCFICADEWLRDYRIRQGGSFKNEAGDRPSYKFMQLAQQTKKLKGERERTLTRWTQWDLDKQAKIKVDPE
eukprot:5459273-Amphidinium_carterae.1